MMSAGNGCDDASGGGIALLYQQDAPALLTWIYLHDHRILLFGKDDV